MHAVVVKVSISDAAGSVKELRETVVPRVAGAPGFVAGYWTRSDDGTNGKSMLVFESEDAAKAAAERIAANVPAGVTFESAEVREVVASAKSVGRWSVARLVAATLPAAPSNRAIDLRSERRTIAREAMVNRGRGSGQRSKPQAILLQPA